MNKMKKYYIVFRLKFLFFISISTIFAEDKLDIDINLLHTGYFTRDSWTDPSTNLWDVTVENEVSNRIKFHLAVSFMYGVTEDDMEEVWAGYTIPLYLDGYTTKIYSNQNFDPYKLTAYEENGNLFDIESSTGNLMAGYYSLTVYGYSLPFYQGQEILDGFPCTGSDCRPCENDNWCIGKSQTITAFIDDAEENFSLHSDWLNDLENPKEIETIESEFLQWLTPGFRAGVDVEFRVVVAAYLEEEGDIDDAISNINNSVYYYDSEWSYPEKKWTETGVSRDMYLTFSEIATSINGEPLKCGYTYVWQVQGRERINGEDGIWGFEEEKKTSIGVFTYGAKVTDLVGPDGSPVSDVLPEFNWNTVTCADFGYEIEITNVEDEDFDNIHNSVDVPQGNNYKYSINEFGLAPGYEYRWRIRVYTGEGLSSWSIPLVAGEESFIIQGIEVIEPIGGVVVESSRPYFNIIGPQNIAHYEILIGDENDENVDLGEVYNRLDEITSMPWQYPDQGIEYGLFPNMVYYWKLFIFDGSGNLVGNYEDYEVSGFFRVMPIILSNPSNNATSVPRNSTFSWQGPEEVNSYELLLSDKTDPELESPQFVTEISGGGSSFDYPLDGDLPLEYEEVYYWRVIPKDINGNLVLGSYSDVNKFTTEKFPAMGESVETSSADVRIPIINIETVLSGLAYTIFIYSDSDGGNIVAEIAGVTSFPYVYTDGLQTLNYGTTYYVQIQATKEGASYQDPSNMMPFVIVPESEVTQCVISCEITDSADPELLTNILVGLEEADEYIVLVSENSDMSDAIEIVLSSGETAATIGSDQGIDWGKTYYTQVVPQKEGEAYGNPSEVKSVSIDVKPGTNDQVGLAVTLPENSTIPKLEILPSFEEAVAGADAYIIQVSSESDMSAIFYEFEMTSGVENYPADATKLDYGKSYYFQAQGLDEDEAHGIKSTVQAIFVPNVKPPVLGDAFSWEHTIPKAPQYSLLVSLVEDFSSLALEQKTAQNSVPIDMSKLKYNNAYYWKVQGLDSEGEIFGKESNTGFFQTESVPSPILDALPEETVLNPKFGWSKIDVAKSYQITVSDVESLDNILWQTVITSNNITYPESATLLNFAQIYYWQVIVLGNEDEKLSLSSIVSFKTQSVFPVRNLLPNGGTETLTPTLTWEAGNKTASYLITVAEDAEFSTVIGEPLTTESATIKVPDGLLKPGKQYYWNIDGLDADGNSIAGLSKPAIIMLPSADNIPLLSPDNGGALNSLNIELKWGALLGADTYTVLISTEPEIEANILIQENLSALSWSIPSDAGINNGTTYYWKIEGITDSKIKSSDPYTFKTPEAQGIEINSPDDAASISIKKPVFSWAALDGVPSYEIHISDKADFSSISSFIIGTNSFEYPGEPELALGTPYYWRIRPLNNEGMPLSSWSGTRNFTINSNFSVNLEAPASGEVSSTTNPNFTWSKIEIATKYEIQVSKNEGFSELIWTSAELNTNSVKYPSSGGGEGLRSGQKYFWRVRAIGESEPLGDFSSPFTFEIGKVSKIELEGPIGNSESNLPYFSWASVSGASSYVLTLASDASLSQLIHSQELSEVFIQYTNSMPPLENSVTYYWGVMAFDKDGAPAADKSEAASFKVPDGVIEIEFNFGD